MQGCKGIPIFCAPALIKLLCCGSSEVQDAKMNRLPKKDAKDDKGEEASVEGKPATSLEHGP
jgi:hypothetical protein